MRTPMFDSWKRVTASRNSMATKSTKRHKNGEKGVFLSCLFVFFVAKLSALFLPVVGLNVLGGQCRVPRLKLVAQSFHNLWFLRRQIAALSGVFADIVKFNSAAA